MNFKRIFTCALIGFMLVMMGTIAVSMAAEEVIEGTVSSVTTAIDKNGQEYTRVLTSFERELQGTTYSVILPVMGFGEQAAPAAQLEQGQTLKAIAQNRMFQGRESYTIIQLIE